MKQKHEKHAPNHERWLVSYADFITLMFAFFVVMYASSKADLKKQAAVAQAINSAFQSLGLFQSPEKEQNKAAAALATSQDAPVSPMNVVMGEQMMASSEVREDLERIKKHLERLLSNQIARHVVAIRIGRDGLVISLREAGFYESGSAAPQPESVRTLDEIAEALRTTPYDIRIEGHTDNVPIHNGQFDSNWELSTARATRLARMFIVAHHYAPARLSASGYAEFHPVASNDSADGRSQNRRVDIIVLPSMTAPARAPAVVVRDLKPEAINAALARPLPAASR
ncbi:flagellar motor protein MotB [Pseudacidobacterium ailaaui]|jgi:chemotaxis protein MotB|uniref:flagellar motor protein MotB n=1 Tax=Pseudacidobacterium ailaaui TaxID=1382359 RepID=UPI0008597D7F|nr:flagellar motor protein MotB [Pseudacidobacterium ailaaui]MBX6360440.1 OmpA family protein [Pseudacidobacterium ailaaui]MCL6462942.1 OmpA family protein [Pseudacidobacterium ailaaui]MDI3254586.1 flagellar motor protein MotB [Bacillota bacterium]